MASGKNILELENAPVSYNYINDKEAKRGGGGGQGA